MPGVVAGSDRSRTRQIFPRRLLAYDTAIGALPAGYQPVWPQNVEFRNLFVISERETSEEKRATMNRRTPKNRYDQRYGQMCRVKNARSATPDRRIATRFAAAPSARRINELALVPARFLPFVLALRLCAPDNAAAESTTLQQFREQYLPLSQPLRAVTDNLRMVVEVTGNAEKCPLEKELFVKASSKLEIRRYLCPPDERSLYAEVTCISPGLSFNLIRPHKDDSFILRWSSRRIPEQDRGRLTGSTIDLYAGAAFSILGHPLPDLLEDAGFALSRFDMDDASHEGARPSATIEFTLASARYPILSGRVRFSPSRSWLITGYEDVRVKWPEQAMLTYSARQSYSDSPERPVIPEAIEIMAFNPSLPASPVQMTKAHISQVWPDSVEDSHFELSKFGLQNVDAGAREWSSRKWQVILSVNVVFFSVLSVAAYCRRRRPRCMT
jgi:hypothetical protein